MTRKLLTFPLLFLVLTACVTINIYFPAAAAEEAARTIVRDVLQQQQDGADPAPKEADGDRSSQLEQASPVLLAVGHMLEVLIPAAHAANADININTGPIRAIRANMERRQKKLAPFYRSGAAGFDKRGLVAIRDMGAVSLKDRNRLKKLVSNENADRKKLYREIAAANGHPEWAKEVQATFAKVWRQEALSGYWYQNANGDWKQR